MDNYDIVCLLSTFLRGLTLSMPFQDRLLDPISMIFIM